jgi:hypothetical protein
VLLTALKEPGMIGLKEPPEGVVFGFRGLLKVA